MKYNLILILAVAGLTESLHAQNALLNGGFEQPGGVATFSIMDESLVNGWETTATDNMIEIWHSGFATGDSGGPVPAYEGTQFAEINAFQNAALYQDALISVSGLVDYSFAHRGRQGNDTLRVDITYLGADNLYGTPDDIVVVNGNLASNQYTASNTAWVFSAVNDAFTSVAGGTYRFSYGAVSSFGGDPTRGNFIDDVKFGVGVVPEPSGVMFLGAAGVLGMIRRRRN